MNHFQSEQEAFDTYFDALLRDPNAQPPAGISPSDAALIRELVKTKPTIDTNDGDDLREKVWNRILFASYAPPNLQPEYGTRPQSILAIEKAKPAPLAKRQPFLFLLAAVFAGIFLSGIMFQLEETSPAPRVPRTTVQTVLNSPPDRGFAPYVYESGNYYPISNRSPRIASRSLSRIVTQYRMD